MSRGKNRDTLFKEWYESDGRLIGPNVAYRITFHKDPEKQMRDLLEYGFIWGWESRANRDKKKKRKAGDK